MSWNWISKLEELRKTGKPFASVTVIVHIPTVVEDV